MKVVVIDDHPLVLEGIKAVLEGEKDIELAGWANNGKEAERLFKDVQPDLALVDLRFPGEYGIDIINKVRNLAPQCRFIILTTFANPDDVKLALDADVGGYVLKDALPQEMISAIRLVFAGRPFYDPAVMQIIIKKPSKEENLLSELTVREAEVLNALSQGLSNKEIAVELYVSENTVKKHISSILTKLGLKDRTKAAIYAVSHCLKVDFQNETYRQQSERVI